MTAFSKNLNFVILWAIVLLAPAMLMTGCKPERPTDENGKTELVYRHATDSAPTGLDPAQAADIYSNFLVVNLYDTLYRYKYLARPYELEPNLAEDLPQVSADGLIYTIRLKPGAHFMDDEAFVQGSGRVVTAEDFVYSIKRHFDPETRANGAWLWQGKIVGLNEWKAGGANYDEDVPGLRALDDRTIQIQLIAPFPQLTHTLAQGYSAIVPREAVEHYGREFSIHPVGSGPFTLKRFDSAGASLQRNPNFRSEPFSLEAEGYDAQMQGEYGLEKLEGKIPPFSDRIDIEFIAEDAARWNTFNSGQVHFVKAPVVQFERILASKNPARLIPELEQKYHLLASLESGFVHTDFNMDDRRIGHHPDPDQDVRNRALRCAIIKAFDWGRRNEVFYSGLGQVFPGVIPPVAPEFDPDQDQSSIRRDTQGAISLLQGAGWTAENLPDLEYGFFSAVSERQMFEQFRSFMTDIGYPENKIKPLTFASYGDYARAYLNREVMLMTNSWTMDYPDAENTMQLFYGPNASPGANTSNYNNEAFNRLYRASASMQASPMRTAMFKKMNDLVIKDCVSISGISRTLIMLWDRNITLLPDREFVGGYFFRFADVSDPRIQEEEAGTE